MRYVCKMCGTSYTKLPDSMRCCCGASLWMDYEHHLNRTDIRKDIYSLWRYEAGLPIRLSDNTVSLGEGLTPLVKTRWAGREILVKNESLLPTGSFKDRGISMVINCLKEENVRRISEDSSGNAGASMSAYAAKAGIICDIYVPEYTSDGKIAQAVAFGSIVHKIRGTRDDTARVAQSGINEGIYAGHNWHPAFVEGVKTVAYEIWEQNGFKEPDAVICAVGNGSMAIGLFLGFKDLLNAGEIKKIPKIYGVQSENCNTICRIFAGESIDYSPLPTLAEGIALYRSSKGNETADMVRESGGIMVSVSENEIVEALRTLIKQGFFAEPTSAAAFAGLNQLMRKCILSANDSVTVIISGNGLKASNKIFSLLNMK